jgi:hypothetical protein
MYFSKKFENKNVPSAHSLLKILSSDTDKIEEAVALCGQPVTN